MRLDQKLTLLYPDLSRSKAQDAIKEGLVKVNDQVITKSSTKIEDDDRIELQEPDLAFASRAGFKLYDVLDDFHIDLTNRICMDVGASTGGFTDVCLQHGAAKVYSIDVGVDQLIKRLREDPRVVNMEHCNCRYLTKDMFEDKITFACMDVSFISVKLILPALFEVLDQIELVVLIKPQFEAGKQNIGKNGIVKDPKVHMAVLQDMVQFVADQGYYISHLQSSSILGRDGNKEFVMHITNQPSQNIFDYKKIVKENLIKR